MNVEFLATKGFTEEQVKQLKGERKQLEEQLRRSSEIVRFMKGVSTLHF